MRYDIKLKRKKLDMAKLVDAIDLIGLSLGMETYQVKTFKFGKTLELKMRSFFLKTNKYKFRK